ncbi:MAG: hypothetical protein RLZZ230_807 [Candidatus Parcubacteria bacterium]|jgi:hypothetical protein
MNNTKTKLIIAGLGALLFIFVLYGIVDNGNGSTEIISPYSSSTAQTNLLHGDVVFMPDEEEIIDIGDVLTHQPINDAVPELTEYKNTKYHYSLMYPSYDSVSINNKMYEMEEGDVIESDHILVAIGKYGFVTVDYVGDITATTDANDQMKQLRAIAETKRTERINAKRPDSTIEFTRTVGDIEKIMFAGVEGYGFSVREQTLWEEDVDVPARYIDRSIPYILVEHKAKVIIITHSLSDGDVSVSDVLNSFKFTE